MPWFCRTLLQEVSEDIEVRLCSNEGISNEEVYVELLNVYVQWTKEYTGASVQKQCKNWYLHSSIEYILDDVMF